MHTYISFLRGINVGKSNRISMSDLRAVYSDLGYGNVATYLQSGNVVFESTKGDKQTLRTEIENRIYSQFGLSIPVILLTADELETILIENPFQGSATNFLFITLLYTDPGTESINKLLSVRDEKSVIEIEKDRIYIKSNDGNYKDIKFTNQHIEKILKVKATSRNWKTMLELLKLSNK